MKRFVCFILCLAMIASLSVCAIAADDTSGLSRIGVTDDMVMPYVNHPAQVAMGSAKWYRQVLASYGI